MRRFPAVLILALALALGGATASHSHGTERHFGTAINGKGPRPVVGGAPEFTVLALGATLNGIERGIDNADADELHEDARRLPRMARELVERSATLGAQDRQQIDAAAEAIIEGAKRIDTAVARRDADTLLQETTALREHLAVVENLLRAAKN